MTAKFRKHSYRWSFSNKFFIFSFFVEISTATPHQHPCQTFVLVFGMTLEIKNLRKTIFEFYQFPVKIILVGLCLKALNSIEKLHHPSEMNRIENYGCFQVVDFILRKGAKFFLNKLKMNSGKAIKMKICLKMTLKWPYLSQKLK